MNIDIVITFVTFAAHSVISLLDGKVDENVSPEAKCAINITKSIKKMFTLVYVTMEATVFCMLIS